MACDTSHIECIRLLLSFDGIDCNKDDIDDTTPLHLACIERLTDIVSLLLSSGSGIDVNRADRTGRTPLYIACEEDYTDIVRLLLSNGNGIDVSKADRLTVWYYIIDIIYCTV